MLKAVLEKMRGVFREGIITQGADSQKKGHVLAVRMSDGLLMGRVKGELNQLYNVYIDLKKWPNQPSRCGCQQEVHCQHAVACLYEMYQQLHARELPPPKRGDEIFQVDDVIWYSEVNDASRDFFSYQLGILIDDTPVDLLPVILKYCTLGLEEGGDDKIISLPIVSGKTLQIPLGRIKPLLRLLLEFLHQERQTGETLQMKRYQLMLFQEAQMALQASKARFFEGEKLQLQLQQLTKHATLPIIPKPQGLQTELREYQHLGLNWLQFLRVTRFGGVLADDMGLGKTVQTLAHLLHEKESGRMQHASLIVAPTSLLWNWYDEAIRFTKELRVLVFHGADRHDGQFDDYDLVISTYGLMLRDKARFLDYPFYYLILDEAQFIKNARTKTTQVIQQLQGTHRLCLTGTPLENHLGELWSLFHFLMPGLLGHPKSFRQFFKIPIEKEGSVEKREMLIRRISPFMLRRTKNQVARELPAKTETTLMLELTGSQRDLYEIIRLSMEKQVREAMKRQGFGQSHILFLDALLKLRQVCCDPRLLSLPQAKMAHGVSVKLDGLMALLDNLMEEGRSVLVFSQFTSMLQLIEERLKLKRYEYLKLTGQTVKRQEVVNEFQSGKKPIFLISLKAGGIGLNLTKADTVIHYDPWWNPAVEDQATDRSHRIGQTNPVFVYKLLTSGTVEEVILKMQMKKRELFEGVLSNHPTQNMSLTEEDIAQFFAPLTLDKK